MARSASVTGFDIWAPAVAADAASTAMKERSVLRMVPSDVVQWKGEVITPERAARRGFGQPRGSAGGMVPCGAPAAPALPPARAVRA